MTWIEEKWGHIDNVTCQECEENLVLRTNSKTGVEFMGCSGYPDCEYTEPTMERLQEIQDDIDSRGSGYPEDIDNRQDSYEDEEDEFDPFEDALGQ